jgi:hypothetical protein
MRSRNRCRGVDSGRGFGRRRSMTPIRLPATSQPLKWVPRASPHPRGLRVPPPRGVPRQTSNRGIYDLDQSDRGNWSRGRGAYLRNDEDNSSLFQSIRLAGARDRAPLRHFGKPTENPPKPVRKGQKVQRRGGSARRGERATHVSSPTAKRRPDSNSSRSSGFRR